MFMGFYLLLIRYLNKELIYFYFTLDFKIVKINNLLNNFFEYFFLHSNEDNSKPLFQL